MTVLSREDINNNRLIIAKASPWSSREFVAKKSSYKKGEVPAQLKPYLFKKGGVVKECAEAAKDLKGKEKIQSINSCVSAKLKK